MTLTRTFYSPSEIAELRLLGNKVFGVPAASLKKGSGNANNITGYFGEQVVGNLLNLIAMQNAGAYVCHSVACSNRSLGETDHVFIFNDSILLIETKTLQGHKGFKVNHEGVLMSSKDGKKGYRSINDSHAKAKREHYRNEFPNHSITTVFVIVSDSVHTWNEHEDYILCSMRNFMTVIKDVMDSSSPTKEPAWSGVKQFASMCMQPVEAVVDNRELIPTNREQEAAPKPELFPNERGRGASKGYVRPVILRH